MTENYYNGKYTHNMEVIIASEDSETCLLVSKKIKSLCSAWFFSVDISHYKWKKSSIDKRSIMINQTDYPSNIIAFKESLRCICFHYDLFLNTTVEIIDKGTIPENSISGLIN